MFSIQTKTHQYYTTHSIALTTSIIQFYLVFGQGIHRSTSPASLLEFQVPPWSMGDGGGRDANEQERDTEDQLDVIGCWFNHFLATLLGDLDSVGIARILKEYSRFSNSNLRRWNSHFFMKICLSFLESCALALKIVLYSFIRASEQALNKWFQSLYEPIANDCLRTSGEYCRPGYESKFLTWEIYSCAQ